MVFTYNVSNAEEKLSKNFKVGEFRCKCGNCEKLLIDHVLVDRLQQIRDHFGKSVHVNSGFRCPAHNKKVGGNPQSGHLEGMAADIRITGVKPAQIAKYAQSIGIARIGLYDCFVHIGSGLTKRFWLGHEGTAVDTFGAEERFGVELPVLRRGSRGEAVKAMQRYLCGYGAAIDTDGSYGPATEAAVKSFQIDRGLPSHGVMNRETWEMMLGIKG